MLAFRPKATGECFYGRADMPAYIHHHDAEPAFVICPSCVGLPMYVKDVAPHWSLAKIDFTYECSDCGAEVRQTVTTIACGASMAGTRSLSSGARSRGPVALPTLQHRR